MYLISHYLTYISLVEIKKKSFFFLFARKEWLNPHIQRGQKKYLCVMIIYAILFYDRSKDQNTLCIRYPLLFSDITPAMNLWFGSPTARAPVIPFSTSHFPQSVFHRIQKPTACLLLISAGSTLLYLECAALSLPFFNKSTDPGLFLRLPCPPSSSASSIPSTNIS